MLQFINFNAFNRFRNYTLKFLQKELHLSVFLKSFSYPSSAYFYPLSCQPEKIFD